MYIIADTELILTAEKRIYHLNLLKEEIADNIILVGDPERVKLISNKFDNIEVKIQHREFVTHTGTLNGKRISAISTGIGTDNIDIVLTEIDALANVNFENRTINKIKKSLNIIRIGTSGALQKEIDVNRLVVSSYGLGFDGLAHFYKSKEILEKKITDSFILDVNWPKNTAKPYFVKASKSLIALFPDLKKGITATAPGFYGPQGRTIRIAPSIDNLQEKMSEFSYKENQILNLEMETSALYYLGRTLGHNTLTICAVIGNRLTKEYSNDYKKTINKLINLVLERI